VPFQEFHPHASYVNPTIRQSINQAINHEETRVIQGRFKQARRSLITKRACPAHTTIADNTESLLSNSEEDERLHAKQFYKRDMENVLHSVIVRLSRNA